MEIFKNKSVVITGGTDGIGAATALELCRLGAKVFIIGRSQKKLTTLLKGVEIWEAQLKQLFQILA